MLIKTWSKMWKKQRNNIFSVHNVNSHVRGSEEHYEENIFRKKIRKSGCWNEPFGNPFF